MKFKIKKIKEKEKIPFVIEDDKFWYCEKCKILYGKDEIVLKKQKYDGYVIYCPKHTNRHMSFERMDYWKKNYKLEKL